MSVNLANTDRESLITCRNSQGVEVRATPLRVGRHMVVFEVYNPYSLVQLSEVLSEFRILMDGRLVYSGRATVANLVNTGIVLVCEATLEEAWLDIDVFTPVNQRERLRSEFENFLKEWTKIHSISPDFKVVVADMQSLLVDLRRWMEQVELSIRASPNGERDQLERGVLIDLSQGILPAMSDMFGRFEESTATLEHAVQPVHRSYIKRQLHPLVLCSPFAYRTFHKPLGYAGDYEMVNMILRDPFEGGSLFAKTVNLWFLSQAPAVAHRNRINYLFDRLVEETGRVAATGRRVRILNLGCGPAGEVQRFLRESPLSDHVDMTLLDFSDETLQYAEQCIMEMKQLHGRTPELRFIRRSVHQLLKDGGKLPPGTPPYDMVYCAGLFDYLSDRICGRLMQIFYEMLGPGGLLVATNVDPSNPMRNVMEYVLDWHLIYRNQEQLKVLHPPAVPAEMIQTKSDDTGVNIYVEIRKP